MSDLDSYVNRCFDLKLQDQLDSIMDELCACSKLMQEEKTPLPNNQEK